MSWRDVREYLFPGGAERDAEFREVIRALSHRSLRVIGAIELSVPGVMLFGQWLLAEVQSVAGSLLRTGIITLLGALTFAFGKMERARRFSRLLALLSGFAAGALMIQFSMEIAESNWTFYYSIPPKLIMVMLVAVAVIPARPMQTLALGVSLQALFLLAAGDPTEHVFLLVVNLICTVLSATLYEQRRSDYQAQRARLEAIEQLHGAHCRVLLSETAASWGRLVAASSHELNSPVGALSSAVDTLLRVSRRILSAPPEEREQLLAVQADLQRLVHDSGERLRRIIGRMQRLTNLDQSDVRPVNLNEMLGDVAMLLAPQLHEKAAFEFDFRPLAPVLCRPQQLNAVFSNVLSNAANAVPQGGLVVISTDQRNGDIEVCITDNGHGMTPSQLSTVFDPGFKPNGEGPVETGSWNLFSCRQIVHAHGGNLRIRSEEGKGTTVIVTMPAMAACAAA